MPGLVAWSAVEQRRRPASSPIWPREAAAAARAPARACLSTARRKPRPNSALSSNSEFDQAGPRPSRVRACRAWSAGCRRRSTSSRWRWRSAARSPKSWVSSLTYGVSPQPAQAPENSKSGCRNCEPLTSMRRPWCGRARAGRGRSRSSPARARAAARCGSMSMRLVLRVRLVLGRADLDAQAAAGAVLGRHLDRVLHALELGAPCSRRDLKVAGAPREQRPGRRPWRGSPRAGRPARTCRTGCRCFGSQTGISSAMLRFSHCVVPVGQVPSTGKALTGSRSPLPAIITAGHPLDEVRRLGRRRSAGGARVAVAVAGTLTSCRCASVASTAAKFCWTTSSPLLAVGLLDRLLDLRRSPPRAAARRRWRRSRSA